MAHDVEDDREDRATGPTYKSLFLGACLVIGSAFGWWFTNFIAYVDTLNARLAVMEVRAKEFEWTFKINGEKIRANEERLRALEHDRNQHNQDPRKKVDHE